MAGVAARQMPRRHRNWVLGLLILLLPLQLQPLQTNLLWWVVVSQWMVSREVVVEHLVVGVRRIGDSTASHLATPRHTWERRTQACGVGVAVLR
jgi:hypothetical protein